MNNCKEIEKIKEILINIYPLKIEILDLYNHLYDSNFNSDRNKDFEKFKNRLINNIKLNKISLFFDSDKIYLYMKPNSNKHCHKERKSYYILIFILIFSTLILNINYVKVLIYNILNKIEIPNSTFIITITFVYTFLLILNIKETIYSKLSLKYDFIKFTTIFTFISIFENSIKDILNVDNYNKNSIFDPFIFVLSVLIMHFIMNILFIKRNPKKWFIILLRKRNLVMLITFVIMINFYENIKISYYSTFFENSNGYCSNIEYNDKIIIDNLKIILFKTSKGSSYYDQYSVQYLTCL